MASCRLCLGCEVTEASGPLIAPCLCSGSVRYIHRGCLDSWRATRRTARTFDVIDEDQDHNHHRNKSWKRQQFILFVLRDIALLFTGFIMVSAYVGSLVGLADAYDLHGAKPHRILHHFCSEPCDGWRYIRTWLLIGTALVLAVVGLAGCISSTGANNEANVNEANGANDDGLGADAETRWGLIRGECQHYHSWHFVHHDAPLCCRSQNYPPSSPSNSAPNSHNCGGCCGGGGGDGGGVKQKDGCWLALVILTVVVLCFAAVGLSDARKRAQRSCGEPSRPNNAPSETLQTNPSPTTK